MINLQQVNCARPAGNVAMFLVSVKTCTLVSLSMRMGYNRPDRLLENNSDTTISNRHHPRSRHDKNEHTSGGTDTCFYSCHSNELTSLPIFNLCSRSGGQKIRNEQKRISDPRQSGEERKTLPTEAKIILTRGTKRVFLMVDEIKSHTCTHPPTNPLNLMHSFMVSSTPSPNHWLHPNTYLSTHSFIHLFTYPLIHLSTYPFIHSKFIYSFINSFIHLSLHGPYNRYRASTWPSSQWLHSPNNRYRTTTWLNNLYRAWGRSLSPQRAMRNLNLGFPHAKLQCLTTVCDEGLRHFEWHVASFWDFWHFDSICTSLNQMGPEGVCPAMLKQRWAGCGLAMGS